MDVFTRSIRGWHVRRSLDHTLTLTALQRALVRPACWGAGRHPAPEIHHSDQGVQYAATAYTQVLQNVNVQISMADVGEAWQNGYAERLIRTIKEEEVDLSEYLDYNDAYRQLSRFLDDVYMHKRIHSSLGYLTPAEFEEQWQKEQALALERNSTGGRSRPRADRLTRWCTSCMGWGRKKSRSSRVQAGDRRVKDSSIRLTTRWGGHRSFWVLWEKKPTQL